MIGKKDGNFFRKSLIVCLLAITVVNKRVYCINAFIKRTYLVMCLDIIRVNTVSRLLQIRLIENLDLSHIQIRSNCIYYI